MEKWADYCISKVQYNEERTHIVKVEVREDKGDTLGSPQEWQRTKVVTEIQTGKTFITIMSDGSGKWRKGREVGTVTINGVNYIRTDRDKIASDNLENLPEF